jgi:ATP-dependent helicase HrpA
VGLRDTEKREYLGARSARWALVPSSSLAKKAPRWVMAAELVETNRMWGRVAARVDPAWVEKAGSHLVKRQYSEPHWERKAAAVMAYERVTLYGIPVVAQRKVNFGSIAPVLSREMFLRSALVDGDWETFHAFFAANRALLEDVEELEHRARRRDIVVDDQALYDFYDARIPADVVSGRHFDAWWKRARHETPDLLTFTLGDLVSDSADALSALDHPDVWVQGDRQLPLTYQFEPGSEADGVTVHVPLAVLNGSARRASTGRCPACGTSSSRRSSSRCRSRCGCAACRRPTRRRRCWPCCRRAAGRCSTRSRASC